MVLCIKNDNMTSSNLVKLLRLVVRQEIKTLKEDLRRTVRSELSLLLDESINTPSKPTSKTKAQDRNITQSRKPSREAPLVMLSEQSLLDEDSHKEWPTHKNYTTANINPQLQSLIDMDKSSPANDFVEDDPLIKDYSAVLKAADRHRNGNR